MSIAIDLPKTGKQARRLGEKLYFTGKPCGRGHVAERYASGGQCTRCLGGDDYGKGKRGKPTFLQRALHPLSRQEAKRLGLTMYVTGRPCRNGHNAPRYIDNRNCRVCSQSKDMGRERGGFNLLSLKAWQKRNSERVAESRNAAARLWSLLNPEARLAYMAKYRKENPQKYAQYGANRRVVTKRAVPKWADHEKIREIYLEAKRLSAETGTTHHVDHVVPLRGRDVSGLHCEANLQILTESKNLSKGRKHVSD